MKSIVRWWLRRITYALVVAMVVAVVKPMFEVRGLRVENQALKVENQALIASRDAAIKQLGQEQQRWEAERAELYTLEEAWEQAMSWFTLTLPPEGPWPSVQELQDAVDESGIGDDGARYVEDVYDCSDYAEDLWNYLTERGWTVWRAGSPADVHALLVVPTNQGLVCVDAIFSEVDACWGLKQLVIFAN